MMKFCLILTTTPTLELAEKIAQTLLTKRIAACVNIIPKITSYYWWENTIQKDEEFLLFVKSSDDNFENIKEEILKLHTYETPEIISIPIEKGLDNYLDWIKKETDASNNS